jgi:Tol biopolymer transport system component
MIKRAVFSLTAVIISIMVLWTSSAAGSPLFAQSDFPSPTPTATFVPLPDHCAATGNTYRLVSRFAAPRRELPPPGPVPSPGGRYQVMADQDGTFVEDLTSGEQMQLSPGQPWYPLSLYMHWSSNGQRLAVIDSPDTSSTPTLATTVYDLMGGLAAVPSIILPTELNQPADFYEWTPNGRYIVLVKGYWNNEDLSIWDVDEAKLAFADPSDVTPPVWSPDQQMFIYGWARIGTDNTSSYGFTLMKTDGSISTTLTPPFNMYQARNNLRYVWSPGSDKVALVYATGGYEGPFSLLVYSLYQQWEVHPNIYAHMEPARFGWYRHRDIPVAWADNENLLFWDQPFYVQYRLLSWSPVREMSTLRLSSRPPFVPHETDLPNRLPYGYGDEMRLMIGRRIAWYHDQETLYNIEVTDLDGSNPVRLVEGADDAGDPDWSPGGHQVLVVWDADPGPGRAVKIAWMNADGTGRGEFSSTHDDIQKVRWSPDETAIFFVGVDEDRPTYSLEMLHLITGEHTVLVEEAEAFAEPRFDYEGAYLSLRWRDATGQQFAEGFMYGGKHLYRFPILGLMWNAHVFLSPNGQFAAIKEKPLYGNTLGVGEGEFLSIVRADGAAPPLILRSGLHGLGDPLWSPDSRLVAFTWQQTWGPPVMMEIFNTAGESVWQSVFGYPPIGTLTEWVTCP